MPHRVTDGLTAIARAAIEACEGGRLVRAATKGPYDAVWAVGKAAPAMALGAGRADLVIGKEPDARLPVLVAAHPVPDESSVRAAQALLDAARAAPDGARVLLLLSGGASSLIGAPAPGVTLDELRRATDQLVRSGARIGEINAVRRRLSLLGGGKLAAATRARLDVLALSDVIGNDPAAIGSGPATPDPTSRDEAIAIARRHGVDEAPLLRAPETPREPFAHVTWRILADATTLRDAAALELSGHFRTHARAALVTGTVEELAAEVIARAGTLAPGEAWVAAGEPTLRVTGSGSGGRAQHLALLVARAIAGRDVSFVACGSDGSDGPTPAAGAAVDGSTWDPGGEAALSAFDSHPYLQRRGATLVTGPSGTNLNDLFLLARGA
jgi:glycerate-2-kinase